MKDHGASASAETGSREPGLASRPGHSGFDPARIVDYIVPRLGRAQRRVLLSLSEEWSEAACHKTARRMFYGVTDRGYTLVLHKHRTDNCWQLSDLGARVKAAIAMEAQRGGTPKSGPTAEGGESAGLEEASPSPDRHTPESKQ